MKLTKYKAGRKKKRNQVIKYVRNHNHNQPDYIYMHRMTYIVK